MGCQASACPSKGFSCYGHACRVCILLDSWRGVRPAVTGPFRLLKTPAPRDRKFSSDFRPQILPFFPALPETFFIF
jgi:hypothetical protein